MTDEEQPDATPEPPESYEHGPCMSALTARQRRFVLAMASDPLGAAVSWARRAGYSDKGERCKVRASELLRDAKVQSAIMEVARATLGSQGPLIAVQGLLAIARNPKHPSHLRAVELLANRVGFGEKQVIEIMHRDLTGDAMLDRIRYLSTKYGLNDTTQLVLPSMRVAERLAATIEHQPPNGHDGEQGEDNECSS